MNEIDETIFWKGMTIGTLAVLGLTIYLAFHYSQEVRAWQEQNFDEARKARTNQINAESLALKECLKLTTPPNAKVIDAVVVNTTASSTTTTIDIKCLTTSEPENYYLYNVTYAINPEFQDIDEYNKEWLTDYESQSK